MGFKGLNRLEISVHCTLHMPCSILFLNVVSWCQLCYICVFNFLLLSAHLGPCILLLVAIFSLKFIKICISSSNCLSFLLRVYMYSEVINKACYIIWGCVWGYIFIYSLWSLFLFQLSQCHNYLSYCTFSLILSDLNTFTHLLDMVDKIYI